MSIQNAVTTGFVDESIESFLEYRPRIITNEPITNEKVLSTILEELRSCESFFLSVAFITSGGVASILGTLLDLEEKGIHGKILVSEYLNFSEPEALRKLLQLSNVELRIARDSDFHSKGFLFTHDSYYTIIIGSSNITQGALTKNKEWNLKVTAHSDSELFKQTILEFDKVFDSSHAVDEEYLIKYSFIYNSEKKIRQGLRNALLPSASRREIAPNEMQLKALLNLENLRASGKNKALLVSATGTGKTYLSAFDVAKVKPKRMLFLVHRRNIAQKAMESFQVIIREEISMGLYSGSTKSLDSDFIFSTVQTFSREEHLHKFEPNHFDYIVIDETHRASASSYQKILEYFNPDFLLGMTATPERPDGLDVFSLFDYNIASEIRLHDAMAHDMLAPFHYFGISDIEINGRLLDDKATINDLNRKDRVDHILKKIKLFGTDDGILRGLIFCSKKDECKYLSEAFNENGYKTLYLTSDHSPDERSRAIDLLETDDLEIKLDYIFTVDIFNEGVDIPRLNQIVMLRPTQSAIIFVQQLGRGLRKKEGKSYLTVLDFIGNYQNNFLVPIALFGDKTYEKDNLRKLINRPETNIIGASTIYFDRIVKEKIYHSIDTGKLQVKRKLVEEYKMLKGKIGRIPSMMDFVEHGERDPYQYVLNYDSYYSFLLGQDEKVTSINEHDRKLLSFLSKEVMNSVRHLDVHLFFTLLNRGSISIPEYSDLYISETGTHVDSATLAHAIHHINGLFITIVKDGKKVEIGNALEYQNIECDGPTIRFAETIINLIQYVDIHTHLKDLCLYSLSVLLKQGEDVAMNDFIINQRYTRKDVFRLLRRERNPVALNVGGYVVDADKKDCALFVNYEKEEGISATTNYHDRFISRNEFIWMSKNKRTINSPDVSAILNQASHRMRIPLFVKKKNIEGDDFYYLGNLNVIKESAVEKEISDGKDKMVPVVEMNFILETPVEKALYDYIVTSN